MSWVDIEAADFDMVYQSALEEQAVGNKYMENGIASKAQLMFIDFGGISQIIRIQLKFIRRYLSFSVPLGDLLVVHTLESRNNRR